MPPRLPLTPEQYAARIREQARARQSRYRERRHATGNVTTAPGEPAGSVTPPQTPPGPSRSLRELEELRSILEPFSDRGYRHDPTWWRRLAEKCPDVDFYLEASNLAEWLQMPAHRKELCSQARIGRWMKKAQADAEAGAATRRAASPVRPAPGRPPDPAPVFPPAVSLQRIDPAAAQRALLEARRLTLPEKLALAKNGKH